MSGSANVSCQSASTLTGNMLIDLQATRPDSLRHRRQTYMYMYMYRRGPVINVFSIIGQMQYSIAYSHFLNQSSVMPHQLPYIIQCNHKHIYITASRFPHTSLNLQHNEFSSPVARTIENRLKYF